MTLFDEIRDARKANGLSQAELGNLVGFPQSHISRIEAGKIDLQISNFIEIARTLDMDLMLIPNKTRMLVENLKAGDQSETDQVPMYRLDDDE